MFYDLDFRFTSSGCTEYNRKRFSSAHQLHSVALNLSVCCVFNPVVRGRIIMTAFSILATFLVTEDTSPQAAEAATCPPRSAGVLGARSWPPDALTRT